MGAGVSAKYIRPEYNLYEKAKDKLSEWAISPILTPIENIQLSESERHRFKIQGSKHIIYETPNGKLLIDETNMDFRDEILHSNPAILEFVCALTYSISDAPSNCPEYQIFNLVRPDSVIANMNHDCLATSFINKKINIIPLHGSMSQTARNTIQKHAAHILEYDMSRFFLRNMIIATKENKNILQLEEYKKFISELEKNNFKYLVIIGYSFFKKNDNDIYDVVTYDLLRSYLHERNCKIIIIDINTDYVADILSKTIGKLNILSFTIHWGCFTHAFALANKVKSRPLWKFSATDIFRFLKYYYCLEKIEPDNFLTAKPYFGKAHDL